MPHQKTEVWGPESRYCVKGGHRRWQTEHWAGADRLDPAYQQNALWSRGRPFSY